MKFAFHIQYTVADDVKSGIWFVALSHPNKGEVALHSSLLPEDVLEKVLLSNDGAVSLTVAEFTSLKSLAEKHNGSVAQRGVQWFKQEHKNWPSTKETSNE